MKTTVIKLVSITKSREMRIIATATAAAIIMLVSIIITVRI